MATIIHDEENIQQIKEIYAILSIDENGNEGICGGGENFPLPLVTGKKEFCPVFIKIAQEISHLTKKKLKLVKFYSKEILEIIGE